MFPLTRILRLYFYIIDLLDTNCFLALWKSREQLLPLEEWGGGRGAVGSGWAWWVCSGFMGGVDACEGFVCVCDGSVGWICGCTLAPCTRVVDLRSWMDTGAPKVPNTCLVPRGAEAPSPRTVAPSQSPPPCHPLSLPNFFTHQQKKNPPKEKKSEGLN